MRRTIARALAVVAGVTALTGLAPGLANAQTLEDVIARNLEAKGGVETLKSTTTVKMTGRYKAQGREMPMTTWAKRPNMVRREADVVRQGPPGSPAAGTGSDRMVTASDGKVVWVMMGTAPPQEVPASQAENMRNDGAEFDSIFVDYKTKGHLVELVGRETKDGRAQYHVKVTRRGGPVQHYYIDAESGLERKIVTDIDQNGTKFSVETELSDYRTVSGRTVPFRTRQWANGQVVTEMSIDSVEFNVPIDDTMFRMPVASRP